MKGLGVKEKESKMENLREQDLEKNPKKEP